MSFTNEEKLSLAAIILAVAAFIISVAQVLQQYLATAEGYRRCQEKVVGPWKCYTKRPLQLKELRCETRFGTPFIELGTGLDRNHCSLPSGHESLIRRESDLVVKANELQHGGNNEWVCWLQLLEELHTFHRALLRAFPREEESFMATSLPHNDPNHDDQIQFLRFPSFSVEPHSWDFMPSDVLKPLARIGVSDLAIFIRRLGLRWLQFRPSESVLRAEGNNLLLTSSYLRGIGCVVTFARLSWRNRFPEEYFMIPNIQADAMGFGILPALPGKSTAFNVSTTSGVINTMKEFEPSDDVIQRLEELTGRRDKFLYAFTDIIPLTAPFMRRRGSQVVRVPAPMERPSWIFVSNTGRAAFRDLLRGKVEEKTQIYGNCPRHAESLGSLQTKHETFANHCAINRIATRSDRDKATKNGQDVHDLDLVHDLWDEMEKYFDDKAQEMERQKDDLYSTLVQVHLKNAVLADKYAEHNINQGNNKYPYDSNLRERIPWNERMAEALGQYTYRFDYMEREMCESGYSSALNWAAKTNNRAIAKTLLPYQADVDAMVDNFSPLMTAAKYGSDLVISLLLRKRERRVNTRNANGQCALWYGVENGSFAVVNRLLQHPRVKIDLPNCQGQTVLWLAVYRGNREFASLLLSRGANPDIKDVDGFSPWIEACISNKNSVKDLLLDFIFAEHNGNCDLVPSPDSMAKQMRENPKRPKHYIFGRLLLELKFEIFSYLSFDELLNFRLVCRDLALLATVDILPRSYWRSRFLLGQEADFLFLDITDTLDWYLIFFGTRASLAAGTLPLINRKRIWQLLEPIAALVGLEAVHKNGPYGSVAHPAQRQSGYYQVIDDESAEKSSRLIEVAGFFSGQLASVGTDSPLGKGCRVIYHRTQSLVPPSQQYRQRIEKSNRYCLLVGLDRYKIVSLGLGEVTNHLEDPKSPSQDLMDSSRVQSHLWTPHPPRHEDLRISILLPSQSSGAFEPLTNIDFGGPRGLLLASSRLTFHMASDPHLFIGIEISYSDGRSILFGSSGGCGISFFIDGSNGERINRIGMLPNIRRSHPEPSLGGLQVFPTSFLVAEFIPISPPSNTITGLVAVEMATPPRFERVGIQSQQCGKQPKIPNIPDCESHQIPHDQLQYDEKFSHFINSINPGNYQTYASLKNVRKIQVCTGIEGRSRSRSRISGLKLEYYNHPSPGIVGQWMHKLDDGFELSQGEDIQSLTIWLIPTGFSRPPFDQVRKLYFERQSDDGGKDTITTAEAYFKDRAIVGLVFAYTSGKIASTGELNTDTRQTVHFALDARVVGLSAVATDHKLMEIEFEVERNEQPRCQKLKLFANLPHDLAATVDYNWREVWCKDDASAEGCRRLLEHGRVYKPPSGSRLVGIYMRCQQFYYVGLLYEPDASQST
ncbi:hypothetical protein PEXP_037990 [Penicillium expansum]|nr:hypothetical protein PEXP_037990 [Penicillium expansum]